MIHEKDKLLWIEGPSGKLEAVVDSPQGINNTQKWVAMICHPHPLHGGNMNNKVVTTLSRSFQESGAYSVRFNYRGVGQSDGTYGDFWGEVEDALAILNWIKQTFPDHQIALGGFSFGARLAMYIAQQQPVDRLITIAPALHLINYDLNMVFDFPWLLVLAWEDEVVETGGVLDWCRTLKIKPELWCLPGASHFFHGKLVYLKKKLVHYLLNS